MIHKLQEFPKSSRKNSFFGGSFQSFLNTAWLPQRGFRVVLKDSTNQSDNSPRPKEAQFKLNPGSIKTCEYVFVFVSIITGLQVTNQAAAPEVRPQTRADVATMPPLSLTWPTQSPATCSRYKTLVTDTHLTLLWHCKLVLYIESYLESVSTPKSKKLHAFFFLIMLFGNWLKIVTWDFNFLSHYLKILSKKINF